MEYDRLGKSGLRVSRISLGCMSFGDPSRGFNEWSLGEEDAGPFFKQAVELGITFWDGPDRRRLSRRSQRDRLPRGAVRGHGQGVRLHPRHQ